MTDQRHAAICRALQNAYQLSGTVTLTLWLLTVIAVVPAG